MTHREHRNPDDFETQADLDLPDSFGDLLSVLTYFPLVAG
jgi:hypothetical protein